MDKLSNLINIVYRGLGVGIGIESWPQIMLILQSNKRLCITTFQSAVRLTFSVLSQSTRSVRPSHPFYIYIHAYKCGPSIIIM